MARMAPMLPAAALYRLAPQSSGDGNRATPLLPAAAVRKRTQVSGVGGQMLHPHWAPGATPVRNMATASPARSPPVQASPLRSPGTRRASHRRSLVGGSPLGPAWQRASPCSYGSPGSLKSGGGSQSHRGAATPAAATPLYSPHAPWRASRVRFGSPLCMSYDITPYYESCWEVEEPDTDDGDMVAALDSDSDSSPEAAPGRSPMTARNRPRGGGRASPRGAGRPGSPSSNEGLSAAPANPPASPPLAASPPPSATGLAGLGAQVTLPLPAAAWS